MQFVLGHAKSSSTAQMSQVSMAQSEETAGVHVPWKPRPVVGGVKTLFLLVEFMDVRLKSSMIEIQSIIESENTWFNKSSYGKMHIDYDIYNYTLTLPWPMAFYGRPEPGSQRGDCNDGLEMYYDDIIDILDARTDVNLADYKDVVIIHAGGDEAVTDSPYDIWSHCLAYGPVSDELGEDGLWVTARNGTIHNLWGIATFSETEPPSVFVHEYCHSLGVSDLYIYGSDGYSENTAVSFWSNMDSGAWLDPPADLDGWSKYILGWIQPLVLDSPQGEYNLHTLDSNYDPKAILMKISNEEYYFVHARRKVGTDSALPAEGVLVFRINVMREQSYEDEELAVLIDANPDTPEEGNKQSGELARHYQLLDAPYNKNEEPYSFSLASISAEYTLSNNFFWDKSAQIAFLVEPLGSDTFKATFGNSPRDIGVDVRDFSLACSPPTITVKQDEEATFTIDARQIEDFQGNVMLAASELPPDATYTFNPSSGRPDFTSELIVKTASSTPIGTYTIIISGSEGGKSHSLKVELNVEEKNPLPRCVIATAAYGSELSPQVQALRMFRDRLVLSTFAGSQFMKAFNAWYYSFSPSVAGYVTESPTLQMLVRALIYPLIGILQISTYAYLALSFNRELGVTVAGLVARSLIGLVYGSPGATGLLVYAKKKKWLTLRFKSLEPFVYTWIVTFLLIGVSEMLFAPALMIVATTAFIVLTLGLSATLPGILVARKLR